MPVSNDNQDYGKSDEKNKSNQANTTGQENKMTADDLKGKQQVDADIEKETDKAAEQK
jgi:hypothetical protein